MWKFWQLWLKQRAVKVIFDNLKKTAFQGFPIIYKKKCINWNYYFEISMYVLSRKKWLVKKPWNMNLKTNFSSLKVAVSILLLSSRTRKVIRQQICKCMKGVDILSIFPSAMKVLQSVKL